MAKKIKKTMAMVLALCICFSALPLQALAAEGEEAPELIVTITPSIEGSNGNSNHTVKVEGTTENGSEVKLEGSVKIETETNPDSKGNEVTTKTTEVELTGKETENGIEKDVTYSEAITSDLI